MPLQHAKNAPPALLLMGPTASGKSAVAMQIAQHWPVEIVSVDSAQVYVGMNIGTAKPEAATRDAVPHHLIDLIEPHERYSAAAFRDDALTAMREITERGNIPLLVGGTMLYYRALLEGLSDLPPADNTVRMVIDSMVEDKGWPGLHQELVRIDPESAARIKPTDSQRIQRALEVFYITNKPMSSFFKKPKFVYLPYRPIQIALIPSDRDALHQRIAARFEDMLESGLINEVRKLRDEYGLEADMPSMRCVGYRQAWMYLDNEISLPQLRDMGVAATRQLAKRQLTWLRSMQGLQEFDCLAEDLPEQAINYLCEMGLKPG